MPLQSNWVMSGIDCRHRAQFSRIIASDCFWAVNQHEALACTITRLLERSTISRVFIIAGIHTGRSVLSSFFNVARSHGLEPDDEGIQEYNVLTRTSQSWKEERSEEDMIQRKQWVIIARLRWNDVALIT
jgi:EEF1A N-terminal glycine/lysine methyltransferase